LNGLIHRKNVSPVLAETRDDEKTQRGHIFNIKFKLSIVNDVIEYKDDKNKPDGHSLLDGKKLIQKLELNHNIINNKFW
tara:strand:- start:255 stop:491 length:237 start_codon:yes stop_codon:yes gene_type:complete